MTGISAFRIIFDHLRQFLLCHFSTIYTMLPCLKLFQRFLYASSVFDSIGGVFIAVKINFSRTFDCRSLRLTFILSCFSRKSSKFGQIFANFVFIFFGLSPNFMVLAVVLLDEFLVRSNFVGVIIWK